jgi:hypothetical protein
LKGPVEIDVKRSHGSCIIFEESQQK